MAKNILLLADLFSVQRYSTLLQRVQPPAEIA